MAELSIWIKPGIRGDEDGVEIQLKEITKVLHQCWRAGRGKGEANGGKESGEVAEQGGASMVLEALQKLVGILEEQDRSKADASASLFGRMGGHMLLLSVLENAGSEEEGLGELAARAVDLCMEMCERFPMKGAAVSDEKHTLRVAIPVESALMHSSCKSMTVHMRRRMQDGAADTDSKPAREISNMLWAGSLVLARYIQACPHLLFHPQDHWPGPDDCICGEACAVHNGELVNGSKKVNILEIGAGLGGGGLGAAMIAQSLGARADVVITDFDAAAVDVVKSSIRINGLHSESGASVSCVAKVLDWDQLHKHMQDHDIQKCDVLLGAEVIHEIPHAAGVHGAIKGLLAREGVAIIFNGAPKHRFGAQEWEDLIDSDSDLEHVTRHVPLELQHGLESLEEHGSATLRLKFHCIRWRRH